MGNVILAATSKTSSGGTNLLPLLLVVVVVILLYYTMTRRSRQRQASQMQGSLLPGQPVRTTSGMYGTVASAEGDDVVVEVSPGVQIRMMRRAVVPLPPDGPGANGFAGTGSATTGEPDDSAEPYETDEPSDADEHSDAPEPADSAEPADSTNAKASTNGSAPESSADDAVDEPTSQDRNS
jgi:preprotein translocase subunit YajC